MELQSAMLSRSRIEESYQNYRRAIDNSLMQVALRARQGKRVQLADGRWVCEFVSCSYLGLDQHPQVLEGAQRAIRDWGVHLCCARTRFTIEPLHQLEEGLSHLFGGRALVFPSVTAAHMATLPVLANGLGGQWRLVYDRSAHASMQFLAPMLAQVAQVESVPHNDLEALELHWQEARRQNQNLLYLADTVYSMGGYAPLDQLLKMAQRPQFYLYLDDAHGTSVYGERGEGYLLSRCGGQLPPQVIMAFSLAKGFGCNGGGVVVPEAGWEELIRCYGMPYAFSTPLDFSVSGAALASLGLHLDGTVALLQSRLQERIAQFGASHEPIQMLPFDNVEQAQGRCQELLEQGYFTSLVFYPIVPRDRPQLRLCLTAAHTAQEVEGLRQALLA